MTAADTNVRPGGQRPGANAHGAGIFSLARLLLHVLQHHFKLDRKPLLLLLSASLTSACIIPVGPEFQDPPGAKNAPPFTFADPQEGTRTSKTMPRFTVTPADVNLGDFLFAKWITEYPPFSNETFTAKIDNMIPPSGDAQRRPTFLEPDCTQVSKGTTTHSIAVAISDRPFVPFTKPDDLIVATDGAVPRLVHWIWDQSCPSQ